MHMLCRSDGRSRKCGKREHIFIKHDVTRNVDTVRRNVKAFVPFVERTIPKKNALFRPELKFTTVVWPEVRPTCTSKHLEIGRAHV